MTLLIRHHAEFIVFDHFTAVLLQCWNCLNELQVLNCDTPGQAASMLLKISSLVIRMEYVLLV